MNQKPNPDWKKQSLSGADLSENEKVINNGITVMELRTYQREAVDTILRSLGVGNNPVAQLATGTGKSLIAAELARRVAERGGRVWVLAHVQELIAQNAQTYSRHTGIEPGVMCSSLNKNRWGTGVTFGSVQTVASRMLKDKTPLPNLIIVDEVHRVAHGDESQYGQIFARCPDARRVGLSATPWRTDNGLVYGRGKGFWFDDLCHRYLVPQGVAEGYLSPLVGVESEHQLDIPEPPYSEDYDNSEVTEAQTKDWLEVVAESLLTLAPKRKHIAVYCPTVLGAMRAAACIQQVTGWSAGVVTGQMTTEERQDTLARFARGELRVLASVQTLTTGWDMPALDCIVCLRPTTASNLWVQILGRLTRLADGKKNGLVLDYVGNLQRLGGVDMLETYVRQSAPLEPLEAFPRPPREPRKVYPGVRTLAVLDPTSGEQARDGAELTVQVHNVNAVALNTRRGPALMVQYACTTAENARIDASLFITTDTDNAAAREFFARRRLAVRLPTEARRLGWMLKDAVRPAYVTVRKAGKYWNVIHEQL